MSPFVSAAWLAEHLSDVIVLDATLPPVGVVPKVDTRALYVERHIPGAVFFDIDELSDHGSGLPHTLQTAEEFGAAMSALGISDTATIVVYEQTGVFSSPRARWMLRTFGAAKVLLLEGDLQAWVAGGFPVESGEVRRDAAVFHAKLDEGAVRYFADVQEAIAARTQILDARSSGRFSGAVPEPRAGLSSGHMPGAVSVPFLELASDGRLKSAEELREIFAAKKVDLDAPIVTSCGSGVTAAVVSLALEVVGAKDVSLYDGSWAEYASRNGAVIVKDV